MSREIYCLFSIQKNFTIIVILCKIENGDIMKEKARYILVEEYIRNLINNGKLKKGDQLETEVQLAKRFNVSRLTVNKAISRLATEGIIERIPGKGSFVKRTLFFADYKMVGSFTHYMESQNKVPDSKLLEYKIYDSKDIPNVASYLELKEDEKIQYFVKVRTADGEPIAIMTSYVPAKLVPSFDISVLSGSLYDYYDQLGLPRLRTKSRFTAIPSDEYLSEHLEVEKNTALLKHDHITYTIDNAPLEYCVAIYIGYKYAYEIEDLRVKQ